MPEQPRWCWTFPTATFRGGSLQNSLQSCWIPLGFQGPGGLQVPSSFRKGLNICSVFAFISHGCQWQIYRSSLWDGKQESGPLWQNSRLHRNKRVLSKLQKHQEERTLTSQILKNSGTDFICDTCETLLLLIQSRNYNWLGISILLTGNRIICITEIYSARAVRS